LQQFFTDPRNRKAVPKTRAVRDEGHFIANSNQPLRIELASFRGWTIKTSCKEDLRFTEPFAVLPVERPR
jgi:hypothetical protein